MSVRDRDTIRNWVHPKWDNDEQEYFTIVPLRDYEAIIFYDQKSWHFREQPMATKNVIIKMTQEHRQIYGTYPHENDINSWINNIDKIISIGDQL